MKNYLANWTYLLLHRNFKRNTAFKSVKLSR